jgi:signal transduction histidine kinase
VEGVVADRLDERHVLLATLPPTRGQRRLALIIVGVLVVAFGAMLPFARMELAAVNSFVPTVQMALLINDLFTSALLFAQFTIVRARALLVLASGYLFTALIIVPHALTFPGAFAPDGLLGAGTQTSAWLYIFWHAAMPLAVIGYVLLKDSDEATAAGEPPQRLIAVSALAMLLLVCALAVLAINADGLLPRMLPDATGVTRWGQALTGLLVLLGVVALALLWLRRRSVLDLWLMVVICAYLPEVAITAFLAAPRFSLGYYLARLFSLITSSVVLIVLLSQTTALYTRLARSIIARRREREGQSIAMDAVTGSIAHEVKQPLAAIVANAEAGLNWLALPTPDLAEASIALTQIREVGMHAGQVIESTRAIFRNDRRRRAALDVNELINAILAFDSNDLQGRGVSLRLQLRERLPPVMADRVQLQQVVLNLIANAIDAMDAAPDRVRVLTVRSDIHETEDVLVSVEDTGPGIPADDAARVFEAFFTTKPSGTGMGLAICRSIVEAHEGCIWVAPGSLGGTVFCFTLPAQSRPA